MGRSGGGGLRIHQAAARDLALAILSGRLRPGDRLDGEIEQAQALAISRTAYREALRILIAKGLIESRPRLGTRVTERRRWNLLDPDVLAWMLSNSPDMAFVENLFELRAIIEPAAAALAARRRSDEQLAGMAQALDRMAACGLAAREGQVADRTFHRLLLEASGNEALAALAGSIGAAVQWTTHFKLKDSPTPRDPIGEHRAVFEAVRAGDGAAASALMHDLLAQALTDMRLAVR